MPGNSRRENGSQESWLWGSHSGPCRYKICRVLGPLAAAVRNPELLPPPPLHNKQMDEADVKRPMSSHVTSTNINTSRRDTQGGKRGRRYMLGTGCARAHALHACHDSSNLDHTSPWLFTHLLNCGWWITYLAHSKRDFTRHIQGLTTTTNQIQPPPPKLHSKHKRGSTPPSPSLASSHPATSLQVNTPTRAV